MAWGLWALRDDLSEALRGANWFYLGLAIFIALIYLILNASVWGLIVRLVGASPNRFKAAALWIECEAMRWLPGGIWGYASRVVEAKRIGLNKTNGGLSLALELILTVTAWGLLGLIGALFSPRLRSVAVIYLDKLQVPPTAAIVLISLLALSVIALLLFNILGLRDKILKATKDLRQGLLNWKISARALLEYLLLCLFYSLGFLFCLKGIGIDPAPSLIEAGGSYGIAWIVGFLALNRHRCHSLARYPNPHRTPPLNHHQNLQAFAPRSLN